MKRLYVRVKLFSLKKLIGNTVYTSQEELRPDCRWSNFYFRFGRVILCFVVVVVIADKSPYVASVKKAKCII